MNIVLKSMAIGLSLIAGSQAMDGPETGLKDAIPEILRQIQKYQILDLGNDISFDLSIGNLRLVCKNWQTVIDKEIDPNETDNAWTQKKRDFFINSVISAYKTIGYGEDCEAFLNGKLIYTPKEGKPIVLPIANLKNPFSGEFNLLNCGGASECLSINTGYRKGKITKNSNKFEIWFTPWFVAKNNLNSTAKHLEPIFNQTVAPIGIFFTDGWGNDNHDYCYITDIDIDGISSAHLQSFRLRALMQKGLRHHDCHGLRLDKFHAYFN